MHSLALAGLSASFTLNSLCLSGPTTLYRYAGSFRKLEDCDSVMLQCPDANQTWLNKCHAPSVGIYPPRSQQQKSRVSVVWEVCRGAFQSRSRSQTEAMQLDVFAGKVFITRLSSTASAFPREPLESTLRPVAPQTGVGAQRAGLESLAEIARCSKNILPANLLYRIAGDLSNGDSMESA